MAVVFQEPLADRTEAVGVPGIVTARHIVARCLLRPGRTYQQAVEQLSPYERIQDPYPEGRHDLSKRIKSRFPDDDWTLFAFVNNRFERNAVETIEASIALIEREDLRP